MNHTAQADRCPSGKIAFASKTAATHSRGSQRNRGRRMRAYACPICRFWHLSAQAVEA